MTRILTIVFLIMTLLFGTTAPALAQTFALDPAPAQTQTKMRSRGLFMAGTFVTIGGFLMAFPRGDTYRILNQNYCVDTYSVDYGSCGDPLQRKIGFIALAAGLPMMIFGAQKVEVKPVRAGVTASYKVQW